MSHQNPESDRAFWLIMLATAFIAIVFVAEVFIRFYLEIN